MKIDIHAHILPPKFFADAEKLGVNTSSGRIGQTLAKMFAGPEERIRDMDQYQVSMQILSMGPPGVDLEGASPQQAVELARRCNDFLAGVVAKHPKQFQALAVLPLQDAKASRVELERAVKELGLKGAKIFSNVKGKYPDHPDFWPIYELCSQLDVPLYIHPTRPPNVANLMDLGLLLPIGFLFDSSLAVARLIYSQVLEKFPQLKLILAHLGSTLIYLAARLDIEGLISDKERTSARSLLPHPPTHYIKTIYTDTVSHHRPAYYCALETSGPEKIMLGSDYPYSLWNRTVDAIEELDIPREDKEMIYCKNAQRLFKLDSQP